MTKMLEDANGYFEVWKPEHAEPTRKERKEDIEVYKRSMTSLGGYFAYHFSRPGRTTPMISRCSELTSRFFIINKIHNHCIESC